MDDCLRSVPFRSVTSSLVWSDRNVRIRNHGGPASEEHNSSSGARLQECRTRTGAG
jgi:hypothetical protein